MASKKSNYAVYLDNSFFVVSNLECKKCFEKENNCKIKSFSKINYVKNKEVVYINNKCNCKIFNVYMDNQQNDVQTD